MFSKSYLGIARMFNACNIKPLEFKPSQLFEITEQLEEYYDERQLKGYELHTTNQVMSAIASFIENERLIARTKGVKAIDAMDEIGKTHSWVLRTTERRISYVANTLEANPNDFFIETYYFNERGVAVRTYFITEKGMKLLKSNLK